MHKAEDFGIRGVLQDGFETRLVVVHVLLQLSALNIKHVNKNLDVSENVVSLAGEIILHKCILPGEYKQRSRLLGKMGKRR